MEKTPNYELKKPGNDDFYNVQDFNDNFDTIDAELKKLNDALIGLDADKITLPDGKTVAEKFEEITEEIGDIEELNTGVKVSIVAAINEIYQAITSHLAEKATLTRHGHVKAAQGESNFDSTNGVTITHNLGDTNYMVNIIPITDTGGDLGEVFITKASNAFTVYNTGGFTGSFRYQLLTQGG